MVSVSITSCTSVDECALSCTLVTQHSTRYPERQVFIEYACNVLLTTVKDPLQDINFSDHIGVEAAFAIDASDRSVSTVVDTSRTDK